MISLNLNINDHVKVRLTDLGRRLHRQHWDKVFSSHIMSPPRYQPPRDDGSGWSEFQLHELMSLFGQHIGPGFSDLPFEPEIRIDMK